MSSIYKRDSLNDKKFPWWNNILRSAKIFWETAAFIPAALCIFLLPFSGGGLLTKVVLRTFFSDVFLRIAIKNASWQNSKNTFWGISQLFCIEIYVFHQDDTWISMREFEINVTPGFCFTKYPVSTDEIQIISSTKLSWKYFKVPGFTKGQLLTFELDRTWCDQMMGWNYVLRRALLLRFVLVKCHRYLEDLEIQWSVTVGFAETRSSWLIDVRSRGSEAWRRTEVPWSLRPLRDFSQEFMG